MIGRIPIRRRLLMMRWIARYDAKLKERMDSANRDASMRLTEDDMEIIFNVPLIGVPNELD